jgi:2-iminobutanoate/2-iminopropanoate deaminase
MRNILAGKPNGHYSPGIVHNGILYVSGQLSIDPQTGTPPPGGIEAECRQALANLDSVLQAANCPRHHVLMCRLYIPDVSLWGAVNKIYADFFGEHKPARVIVPSAELHYNCLVEIEATAWIDEG